MFSRFGKRVTAYLAISSLVPVTYSYAEGYIGRFEFHKGSLSGVTPDEIAALEGTAGKGAARWSIYSERVSGVAKELFLLIGGLEPYIDDVSTAEGPLMAAVREKTETTDWGSLWQSRQTMFEYGVEMSTDSIEAQILKMFICMARPQRVLEIGMFTGYGATAICEALPQDGKCVSLEIDPFLKDWVEEVTGRFEDGRKHSIIVGPALDTLQDMSPEQPFDFVFVDANKSEYKQYVETILSRNLLAPDGTIVVDNSLYCGLPYMPAVYDTQPQRRSYGNDVRSFNAWVRDHPELMQVMMPIRDGVSIIRRR